MRFGPIVPVRVGLLAVTDSAGAAEKKYGPGVTDTAIKIGQTVPFSGPASSFAIVAAIERHRITHAVMVPTMFIRRV